MLVLVASQFWLVIYILPYIRDCIPLILNSDFPMSQEDSRKWTELEHHENLNRFKPHIYNMI